MKDKIPSELYSKIVENMPICCVDIVILNNNQVLLVLRDKKPVKNEWFFPGGRVLKNETLENAVYRKAKEEIGIEVIIKKKIGIYETFFKDGAFDDLKTGTHTINAAFLVIPRNQDSEINLDKNHTDSRWIDKIEQDFHPYIKQVLKDLNLFTQHG